MPIWLHYSTTDNLWKVDFINIKALIYYTHPPLTQFWRLSTVNPIFALPRMPNYSATVTHVAFPKETIVLPFEPLAAPAKLENIHQRSSASENCLFLSLQAGQCGPLFESGLHIQRGPWDFGPYQLKSLQIVTHSFVSVPICWINSLPGMVFKTILLSF